MFLLISLLVLSAEASIVDCAVGKSLFAINRLAFYPDPPVPNVNVTLDLDFTAPNQPIISSGTAVYSITYNFLPIKPTTNDLCNETECPINPGTHKQSSSMSLPQNLKGTIIIKTNWYDNNENLLLCYSISTKL
jgi:hypothetical protein